MTIIDANALTRVGHVSFDYSESCPWPAFYITVAIAAVLAWVARGYYDKDR